MARIARVVVPEFPHHIIQRGNRRQKVFFNEGDYSEYLRLLNSYSQRFKVDILAYCLMPNHVHLLMETLAEHPLYEVVQGWKSYTALVANRLLGRRMGSLFG